MYRFSPLISLNSQLRSSFRLNKQTLELLCYVVSRTHASIIKVRLSVKYEATFHSAGNFPSILNGSSASKCRNEQMFRSWRGVCVFGNTRENEGRGLNPFTKAESNLGRGEGSLSRRRPAKFTSPFFTSVNYSSKKKKEKEKEKLGKLEDSFPRF